MGNADDERRRARLDNEPFGTLFRHDAASRTGQQRLARRLDDRALARESGRGEDIGMQIAVVFEMRNLAPRRARSASSGALERKGAWKSQPCAAARSSMPTTAKAFSAIGSSRRAPCAAIDTWSSWLAEVGIESTLAG